MSTPPPSGALVRLSPRVRRLIAPNKGPFTYTGTCSYIVGEGRVAIIDPGPMDEGHIAALVEATKGETITAIVVTHTHRDHSPGARLLQQATGAPIIGCAAHAPVENHPSGRADTSHDLEHRPDQVLGDNDIYSGDGFSLKAIATPGHASNHLAFALLEENALFSGDHVMGWSTSVVAPPDGDMRDYLRSLERLQARDDSVYWPGHGDIVENPKGLVRGYILHRMQRETAILGRLGDGDRTIAQIVQGIYAGLDAKLQNAASLSVLAHLEDLVARGAVESDVGAATLDARYAVK
jgi:glyoxylase-like metal-dependent hydrolase (beta-lactamase superfamily II)